MKKYILIPLISILLTSAYAQDTGGVLDKSQAHVEQIEGLYIFIQSKPVADYQFLGSVKKIFVWEGKPKEMLRATIKKVKND